MWPVPCDLDLEKKHAVAIRCSWNISLPGIRVLECAVLVVALNIANAPPKCHREWDQRRHKHVVFVRFGDDYSRRRYVERREFIVRVIELVEEINLAHEQFATCVGHLLAGKHDFSRPESKLRLVH